MELILIIIYRTSVEVGRRSQVGGRRWTVRRGRPADEGQRIQSSGVTPGLHPVADRDRAVAQSIARRAIGALEFARLDSIQSSGEAADLNPVADRHRSIAIR